jgi:HAD superfamily hydrolase (TIGR01509 family)
VRFEAILFDLDGTLVDSHREITLALAKALADLGLCLPYEEAALLVDGQPLEHIWEVRLHGRLDQAARAHGFAAFADAYRRHYMGSLGHATRVYEGVAAGLRRLRAHPAAPKLAVVSNKSAPSVRALLEVFGLHVYFDAMLGAGGTEHAPKPSPALLLHAASLLGAAPQRCAMVGDTALDIRAGRAAAMTTLAVTHGMAGAHELAGADYVVDDFAALLAALSGTR